jgi:hypothetical protein
MALDFHATSERFGPAIESQSISCSLVLATHSELFSHVNAVKYPYLDRFRDFFADGYVEPSKVEALIREIEAVTMEFSPISSVKAFLEPFHSLCCAAWSNRVGIAAYCD